MLVLSRKIGEKIVIDGGIEVVVVRVKRGKVSLSVQAPKDVPIHRKEISDRIESERQ